MELIDALFDQFGPASAALRRRLREHVATGGAKHCSQPRRAEHACLRCNWKDSLIRAYESEDQGGAAPVCRADQAVARKRMSRSKRSCLFSWRKLINSSNSVHRARNPDRA
jgi:hypothetical protein